MPLPKNKSELLKNVKDSFQKLDSEFDDISKMASRKKEIKGGISACDVLAYQIGWGQLLLGWEKSERSGKTPFMPAKGYKWNELGRLAEFFYDEHRGETLENLRRKFKKTVNEVSAMIDELPENELFKPKQRQWTGGKWPMVKWIQINTVAPYSSARTKLRRWKKRAKECFHITS
jgi:hypothetical protein